MYKMRKGSTPMTYGGVWKHTPTHIWICPDELCANKNYFKAEFTCGCSKRMIKYVPKSSHDELLEAAKGAFDIIESLSATAETHAMQTYSRVSWNGVKTANEFLEILKQAIAKAELTAGEDNRD